MSSREMKGVALARSAGGGLTEGSEVLKGLLNVGDDIVAVPEYLEASRGDVSEGRKASRREEGRVELTPSQSRRIVSTLASISLSSEGEERCFDMSRRKVEGDRGTGCWALLGGRNSFRGSPTSSPIHSRCRLPLTLLQSKSNLREISAEYDPLQAKGEVCRSGAENVEGDSKAVGPRGRKVDDDQSHDWGPALRPARNLN